MVKKSGKIRGKLAKTLGVSVAGVAALSMLVPSAWAGMGSGGGGVSGNTGLGPSGDLLYLQDDNNYDKTPTQGWGDASISYAIGQMHKAGYSITDDQSTTVGKGIYSACRAAVSNAIADKSDGPASQARVVGIAMTIGYDGNVLAPWGTNTKDFTNRFQKNWDYLASQGITKSLKGWDAAWVAKGHQKFIDGINTQGAKTPTGVSVVCLAVNNYEPPRATPPAPPTKQITPGTSADSMTNTTTITSKTGVGGTKMVFDDRITPNGVTYTTGNYRVTDNGADASGQFDFAHNGNDVTATWKGGKLPENHEFRFIFDVTVTTPDFSKVSDGASVTWNDKGTGTTDNHEFPTWRPNPDKSWIKQGGDGKWQAVIDPGRTNRTGADDNVFLDGDVVASVANGTVAADLAQAPRNLSLSDDWTKADYLFDAADASRIRVYEADATTDRQSSVTDITNKGKDVTDQFTIGKTGTKATATAKASYLAGLKGLAHPRQLTLLIPGTIDFANGKGAERVREDFNKPAGGELTFCTSPDKAKDDKGAALSNAASETVNGQSENTNEPKICGYVPPVSKDVVGEASQGGDQASVDGKVVYPGQKVEYQLLTTPKLPASMAYGVRSVSFTDTYDSYLDVNKASLELMDLNTGKVIPKTKYATKWDDAKHMMTMTVTDKDTIAQWRAGSNPRVQLQFQGTVDEKAPTDHKVNNKWVLTLNNSVTPSNEVFNIPPEINPNKEDNQSGDQGDPTVSIDGKTMLLGDTGNYVVNLDAKQKNDAYNVWRLGVVDDFDDRYVSIDPSKIEVVGADGKDYTARFNVKLIDGVVYAFAKTVDTKVPATGETVKGDPQPADLKAYSQKTDKDHNPMTDPAIDQSLLGQSYQVIMPYKVIKVTDGYVVRNTATQITNNVRKVTNQVSNPLKPLNPKKDVTIKVGGDSIDGQSVYLNSTFLYQLDSSTIPANRAYPDVTRWSISDHLNKDVDQYTGQWAVYATSDLYKDGKILAAKGDRIAGNGFDSSAFGSDLFTASQDANGVVTVTASDAYRKLVSANDHDASWRAYIQCKRIKVTDRQDNQFTEYFNDKVLPSNVVWTRTPDLTPSLHIVKWDAKSGIKDGDRNLPSQALTVNGDTDIVFTITNTSKDEDGHGAVFQARDLHLEDRTVAGDGTVVDFRYPADWNTLVLKPGQSVDVHGTLKGVSKQHTDRAQVTGKPLVACPAANDDPFGKGGASARPANAVDVDGRTLCSDTKVASNFDDWNGKHAALAITGSAVGGLIAVFVLLASSSVTLLLRRRAHGVKPASNGSAK